VIDMASTPPAQGSALPSQEPRAWLNRNIMAMGATSLLSDASHEAATAALPGFLAALGLPPAALGIIEGVADATSSFVKLGAGWLGDRSGRRFELAVAGYGFTGVMPALLAMATSWPLVLLAKALGWFGRGVRGPLRDAMLAESVEPAARGRAFGFHRAGDTIGAVIGPLLTVVVLGSLVLSDPTAAFRTVFWIALVPGLAAVAAFALFVRDPGRGSRATIGFRPALRAFGSPFRRFLVGVGLFGLGDFAPTLLILATTVLLTPSLGLVAAGALAALLYVLRNVVYAIASFPFGAASDRLGQPIRLLAGGYLVGAVVAGGTALAFALQISNPLYYALIFALSGVLAAAQDTLEGVATAELGGSAARATAFGVLASVNGVGDLVASAGVGLVWSLATPTIAFGLAAAFMLAGSVFIVTVPMEARQ
jgi:MFS family permease